MKNTKLIHHRLISIALGVVFLWACPFVQAKGSLYKFESVRTLSGPHGADSGNDMAVDANNGDIFIIGFHAGLDFNNDGKAEVKSYGVTDPLISKSRPNGEAYWVRAPGSPGYDTGKGIAPDQKGGAYVVGEFEQSMLFRRSGNKIVSNGLKEIYLARYDADGNVLWAKALGGAGNDGIGDVGTDANGNIYIVGTLRGEVDLDRDGVVDFTTTADAGFLVASYDANGTQRWAKVFAGRGTSYGGAIAVSSQGDVFVAGPYNKGDVDLDNDGSADLPSAPENYDTLIARFDATGGLSWAISITGPDYESIKGLALAGNGDLLVAGVRGGSADFDGDGQPDVDLNTRDRTIFLARFNDAGEFLWVRTFEARNMWHLAANENYILLSGAYVGELDFDGDGNIEGKANADGRSDGYVAILNNDGSLQQVLTITGPDDDQARAAGFSPDGKVLYVTGYIRVAADFDGDKNADAGAPEIASAEFFLARYVLNNKSSAELTSPSQSIAQVVSPVTKQAYVDDPGNPWMLGYRWRGEPPSTLELNGSMVQKSGYVARLINSPRARRSFQYYATNSVTTGIEFEVEINQSEGPMTIELIEFRLVDPNKWEVKSDEDVQIRVIHASVTVVPGQVFKLSGGAQVPDNPRKSRP